MGFVTPTTGRVEIDGRPVREAQNQSWVAYVPQAEEVDWTFPVSVHDVVMMGRYGYMNFLRIAAAADRTAVETSLRRVGMWDYRDRQIGELSGGQKKRVFVARALAQAGRVILLDEPFTGVDVGTEEAIVSLLRELRDEGRLILVSTHNLGSVPEFCDQVVLINRTVLAYGPTSEVFTAENLTRAFGGALRLFDLAQSTVNDHDGRSVTVLTDDERPLVLGKRGHLEYLDRTGRENAENERDDRATPEIYHRGLVGMGKEVHGLSLRFPAASGGPVVVMLFDLRHRAICQRVRAARQNRAGDIAEISGASSATRQMQ
jgi:manganese/iron transport system ATP-binding protein